MKTIALALALVAAPAAAQDMAGMDMGAEKAAPVCVKAEIVTGFEGWGKGTLAPQLVAGGFSVLALAPSEAVKFTPALNRPAKPGDMGGIYAFSAKKSGIYRFAIDPGTWIDVIGSKGQRLESKAHVHGPACSGITKIVDYELEKDGEYVVQFSATQAKTLRVMVIGPVAPF